MPANDEAFDYSQPYKHEEQGYCRIRYNFGQGFVPLLLLFDDSLEIDGVCGKKLNEKSGAPLTNMVSKESCVSQRQTGLCPLNIPPDQMPDLKF